MPLVEARYNNGKFFISLLRGAGYKPADAAREQATTPCRKGLYTFAYGAGRVLLVDCQHVFIRIEKFLTCPAIP